MSREYPSDWDIRRKEVLERDDYTCQNCGRKGGHLGNTDLEMHHIVPKRNWGLHHKDNLTTLCNDCHKAITHDRNAPTAPDWGNSATRRNPTTSYGSTDHVYGDKSSTPTAHGYVDESSGSDTETNTENTDVPDGFVSFIIVLTVVMGYIVLIISDASNKDPGTVLLILMGCLLVVGILADKLIQAHKSS